MPLIAVRLLSLWLLLAGLAYPAQAQTAGTDSLRGILAHTPADSSRVLLLLKLAHTYRASRPDSTLHLAQQAWQLARQVGFAKGRGRAQGMIGAALRERGELPKAFANQLIALEISQKTNDLEGEASSQNALGNISFDLRQYRQAIYYYSRARALYARLNLPHWLAGSVTNIGSCYEKLGVLDSALLRQQEAEKLIARHPRPRLAAALALRNMGVVQARLGHPAEAMRYYRRAQRETYANNDLRNRAMTHYHMAMLYQRLHQPDSSLVHARLAVQAAQKVSFRLTIMEASSLLTRLYQARHNVDSAFHYQGLYITAHDQLFGPEKFQQLQLLSFNEQQRQVRQREAGERQTVRYQRSGLLAGLVFLLLMALLFWRSSQQQRRVNAQLSERNSQIKAQRNDLSKALEELRAAQTQLVAAEKWAFVGELSAGIAHELQNPLAFMQNFANVSVALLDPDARPTARDRTPGLEQEILAGLRQNLREISQHGQRASAIIADMLAHARTGTSQQELVDLNALVEENLRLAYYGSPVPDGTTAVELHTSFGANLAQISVVPSELGRALLNLFANALYAVRHRQQQGETGYRPLVSVSTRRVGEEVEIRVHDNGVGMSEATAAQAFQPFFTTKPMGDGTGLGLSLSHDIVVKGHRGTLSVESREGAFTEFTVRVPA
ncbi:ATP-binding protein [Hymenobacter antarcticus]|uniref:histidine kinase n=1 Tax=Hymenobacter antarcticus TaxID=486270 RepID=A0ABP7P4T4_9BACT